MNKDQAIEACAKAIAKIHGYKEENWKDSPNFTNRAADIVAALEALELFKPTADRPKGDQTQVTNQPKPRGKI
jgi:hypothetical protein